MGLRKVNSQTLIAQSIRKGLPIRQVVKNNYTRKGTLSTSNPLTLCPDPTIIKAYKTQAKGRDTNDSSLGGWAFQVLILDLSRYRNSVQSNCGTHIYFQILDGEFSFSYQSVNYAVTRYNFLIILIFLVLSLLDLQHIHFNEIEV